MRAAAVFGLVALALAACDGDRIAGDREGPPPRGGPPLVSGAAEVVGDAPLSVSLTGVEPSSQDDPALLLLTLQTTAEAGMVIEDLRWMFTIDQGPGLLALAGPGCEPEFTAHDEVMVSCGDEARVVELGPHASVIEEIRVHVPPAGFPVADGIFTFTQPITWTLVETVAGELSSGSAVVRLTLEVISPGV